MKTKILLLLFICLKILGQEYSIELLSQFRGHGKITTYDIKDDRLFLISGNLLEIFQINQDNSFQKIGEYEYPVDYNSKPTQIYVRDNFLFSNNGHKGLWVIDVSDMESIRPRRDFFPSITNIAQGFEIFNTTIYFNQVIGYGSSNILFADISDPLNIKELGSFKIPFYSENFSYRVKDNYLYIVAQKYYEYNYLGSDLIIVDITDYKNPKKIFQEHSAFSQIELKNNILFVSDSSTVLKLFDVTNKQNPVLINKLSFNINSNYSKSINFLIEGNYLFVNQLNENLDRKCWLYNLDAVNKPEKVDSIVLPYEVNNTFKNFVIKEGKLLRNNDYSLEYNQIENNKIEYKNKLEFAEEFIAKEVTIDNKLVYLLSDRGFYIIDISNPNDPFLKSQLKYTGSSFFKEEKFIYLSGSPDLRIIDVSDTSNPYEIGYWDSYGSTNDVVVRDNYAYLAYSNGDWQNPVDGFKIIDLYDKENPIEIATIDLGVRVYEMFVDSTNLYILAANSSLDSLSGIYI